MKQIIVLLLLAILPCILAQDLIDKTKYNARQDFALNFYRRLRQPNQQDFVISPAALQKLLAVLNKGARFQITENMQYDLCLRERNHDFSIYDRSLADDEVLYFFDKDFSEAQPIFSIKNFILTSNKKRSYIYSSEMSYYFNVTFMETEDADQIVEIFGDLIDLENLPSYNRMRIFSEIKMETTFVHDFVEINDKMIAEGKFRYGMWEDVRLLEIPLKANVPLSLLILMPKHEDEINGLIQSFNDEIFDFNDFNQHMNETLMHVVLPALKFENKTDLVNYFKYKIRAIDVVKKFFTGYVTMSRAFVQENNEVQIDRFWQKTNVDISCPTEMTSKDIEPIYPDTIFDATKNSFLFVIKSQKVVYFIGEKYV